MGFRHCRDALRQILRRFGADNKAATALEYVVIFVFLSTIIVSTLPLFTTAFAQAISVYVAALNK